MRNHFVVVLMLVSTIGATGTAEEGNPSTLSNDWGIALTFLDPLGPCETQSLCRDAMGNLWGIVCSNRNTFLARWSAAGWQPAAVLFNNAIAQDYCADWEEKISEAEPTARLGMKRLIPGPDGSVLAISDRRSTPSLQVRGNSFRWVPPVEREKFWAIYEDSAGNAWILGTSHENILIEDTGHPSKLLYGLPDERAFRQLHKGLRDANFAASPLLKDAFGRYWYTWNPSMELNARNDTGHSLLVFDKDYLKRPAVTSGNQAPISVLDDTMIHEVPGEDARTWQQGYVCFVTPKDERTLWVGTSYSGLYQVDLASLTATSAPAGSQRWCDGVTQVARLGENWYAVAEQKGFQLYQITTIGPSLVIGQLDGELTPFAYDSGIGRPILETKKGLWLGCDKNGGAYFVPKDGSAAMRIDWERGLCHGSPTFIEPLSDGRLFFGGPKADDCIMEEDKLIAAKESPSHVESGINRSGPKADNRIAEDDKVIAAKERSSRMEAGMGRSTLFQDIHGSVWTRELDGLNVLLERWENGGWRRFRTPLAVSEVTGPLQGLACDAFGRLWVSFIDARLPVALFEPPPTGSPEDGRWIQYQNYMAAVLGEYPAGIQIKCVQKCNQFPAFVISKGPNETLAFTDGYRVYYYHETRWSDWPASGIVGREDGYGMRQAWIDRASGDLLYSSGRGLYRYSKETQWHPVRVQESGRIECPPFMNYYESDAYAPHYAPPNPDRVSRDYLGLWWIQYGTALYRAGYGLCLCVVDKEEKTPFVQGVKMFQAMQEPGGDVWIGPIGGYPLLLHPDRPLPETEASIVFPQEPDIPVVEATTGEGAKAWFTWRSDQGDWQQAGTSPLIIKGLESGDHRIEVRAIDERFQLDPTHVSLSVTIPEYQEILKGLVDEMSSEDNGVREKALARFMQRGKEDIVNLKAACEKVWSGLERELVFRKILRTHRYLDPGFGTPFLNNSAI